MKHYILLMALLGSALASSTAGAIVINETFANGQGEFIVTNDTNQGIFAFFVGNDTTTQADKSGPGSELDSWKPAIVTRTQWEAGTIDFPDAPGAPPEPDHFTTGPIGPGGFNLWTPPDTTQISWDDNFGANTNTAIGYWSDGFLEVPQRPIFSGETLGGFIFYASQPNSPFVTFGSNGIIEQGETTVVPIPAAVWMFGSGLIALRTWRKKLNFAR